MNLDQKLKDEINRLHAQICGGLADPTRILILYTLSEQPCSVTELTLKLESPQPTISRHLQVLRERNMVHAEREGNNVIYSLVDDRVIEALDLMRSVLSDIIKKQASLISIETNLDS